MKDKNFIIERQILRIGNKISNGRDKDLIPFDLTANQSEALLYFDNCPGRSIIDLKEHLRITHQAARNLVERMKRKELLYVSSRKKTAASSKCISRKKAGRRAMTSNISVQT